jgi:hypothetical protein
MRKARSQNFLKCHLSLRPDPALSPGSRVEGQGISSPLGRMEIRGDRPECEGILPLLKTFSDVISKDVVLPQDPPQVPIVPFSNVEIS